jgi:UDP:flavonoid glycosyltransferase YjiC (YdhE family)
LPGKRIFAYIKEFPGLDNLLGILALSKLPTVVYAGALAESKLTPCAGGSIVFQREPVELNIAGRECDLAITHATHGTTAAMLTAGKPLLMFPLNLEQRLTAQGVVKCGAGVAAKPEDPAHIGQRLAWLTTQDKYAVAARAFSLRHASLRPADEIHAAVSDIEGLLSPRER